MPHSKATDYIVYSFRKPQSGCDALEWSRDVVTKSREEAIEHGLALLKNKHCTKVQIDRQRYDPFTRKLYHTTCKVMEASNDNQYWQYLTKKHSQALIYVLAALILMISL